MDYFWTMCDFYGRKITGTEIEFSCMGTEKRLKYFKHGFAPPEFFHLATSIFRGERKIIQLAIQQNLIHVNKKIRWDGNIYPIQVALKYYKYEIASDLIKAGADITVKDEYKNNIFHELSPVCSHLPFMQELLLLPKYLNLLYERNDLGLRPIHCTLSTKTHSFLMEQMKLFEHLLQIDLVQVLRVNDLALLIIRFTY